MIDTELDFAAALARLAPQHPTEAQKALASSLLDAFSLKALTADILSRQLVDAKEQLHELQSVVADAVAKSLQLKPLPPPGPVQTFGQPKLKILRALTNLEAKKAFDGAKGSGR